MALDDTRYAARLRSRERRFRRGLALRGHIPGHLVRALLVASRTCVCVRSGVWALDTKRSKMTSNNTLERTVNHRGRIVLAMDCVLADTQCGRWPAAQLGR